MPLSLQDQLDIGLRGLTTGDIDLLSKTLTDPASITPEEQRTTAQRLGIKGGLLSAFVNTVADPTVWMAYLMSKRFPTLSWLTGAIPTRFIGAANEFTGISQYTRPVETYFRGTPVSRLSALAMQRQSEVMKVGEQMFRSMDRPNWKNEMPVVSMLMEGQPHDQATPELRKVADQLRGHMDELWGFLRKSKQIQGGFDGENVTRAVASDYVPAGSPQYLRDYLPHIPLMGELGTMTVSAKEAMGKLGMYETGKILSAAGADPNHVWRPDELGRLTSNFTRYQAFMNSVQGQVWNPYVLPRERQNVALQSRLGQELFVTDLNTVLQKYVHGVARTYAVNAPISDYERVLAAQKIQQPDGTTTTILPSNDPIIAQVINYGLDASGARFNKQQVVGTNHIRDVMDPTSANALMLSGLRQLTRGLAGKLDEGQIIWGNLFASVGRHFDETAGRLTNQQRTQVDDAIRTIQRNKSWRNASNAITNYFYTTTLGGNPWSAFQNFLQPWLTTAPAIGVGSTLAGMRELGDRLPRYAAEMRSQHDLLRDKRIGPLARINEAADRAFVKTFPDLAESGIRPDVRLFDVDPNSTVDTWRGKAFSHYDAFAKFLLQPFNHAELANQATTFFGTKRALKDAIRLGQYEHPLDVHGNPLEGEQLDGFINFDASNVVNATQFRPGPGGRSLWQGRMPSFLRMLTSFPTRAASFMMESTVRGAMSEQELATAGPLTKLVGGRNLGTLARILLYGKIVSNGFRDTLGIDVSGALGVTSPFNLAPPGRVFGRLPVPPVVGLGADLISAASSRDTKDLQGITVPSVGVVPFPRTLVPGGVALNHLLTALNQWRPDESGFVDDNERLMYQGNTSDLILSGLGVPLDKKARLRKDVDRMYDLRGRVKDFRRNYAMAVVNGDTSTMQGLQAQWAEKFKGWPALTVSGSDVERYRSAARMPTVQRMVQSFGSLAPYLREEIYQVDPDLVASPADGAMNSLLAG